MLRSRISKWNELGGDVRRVVLVLLEISKGDITELTNSNHNDENGVWGKASEELFGENLPSHRFWLFACFRDNRRKLKVFVYETESNGLPV